VHVYDPDLTVTKNQQLFKLLSKKLQLKRHPEPDFYPEPNFYHTQSQTFAYSEPNFCHILKPDLEHGECFGARCRRILSTHNQPFIQNDEIQKRKPIKGDYRTAP